MKTLGRIIWFVAEVVWLLALVGHFLTVDKLDTIYLLCLAIGGMLMGNSSCRLFVPQSTCPAGMAAGEEVLGNPHPRDP